MGIKQARRDSKSTHLMRISNKIERGKDGCVQKIKQQF